MDFNVAALTTLCLGFSVGLLSVVSFIERPILPLVSSPDETHAHEDDIRGVHAFLQAFIAHVGPSLLIPVVLMASLMAVLQTIWRDFDALSMFVALGLVLFFIVATIRITPASRQVRDTAPFDSAIEDVASSLFRLVRLHHTSFLALIPLTLAQLLLLFL